MGKLSNILTRIRELVPIAIELDNCRDSLLTRLTSVEAAPWDNYTEAQYDPDLERVPHSVPSMLKSKCAEFLTVCNDDLICEAIAMRNGPLPPDVEYERAAEDTGWIAGAMLLHDTQRAVKQLLVNLSLDIKDGQARRTLAFMLRLQFAGYYGKARTCKDTLCEIMSHMEKDEELTEEVYLEEMREHEALNEFIRSLDNSPDTPDGQPDPEELADFLRKKYAESYGPLFERDLMIFQMRQPPGASWHAVRAAVAANPSFKAIDSDEGGRAALERFCVHCELQKPKGIAGRPRKIPKLNGQKPQPGLVKYEAPDEEIPF